MICWSAGALEGKKGGREKGRKGEREKGSKVKVKCGSRSYSAPSGYVMNWWRPLGTCQELVLSKFVRLIFRIGLKGVKGHVALLGRYVVNYKLVQRTSGAI